MMTAGNAFGKRDGTDFRPPQSFARRLYGKGRRPSRAALAAIRQHGWRGSCEGAGDGGEPPHVHVERDEWEAKFWLEPIRLQRSRGFPRREINRVRVLIEEHREPLLESWNEFFRE